MILLIIAGYNRRRFDWTKLKEPKESKEPKELKELKHKTIRTLIVQQGFFVWNINRLYFTLHSAIDLTRQRF